MSESRDSRTYLRVTQTRIFLLFGILTFYIFHFTSRNCLISCASSFFTYIDAYVCILTLNRQTIPCRIGTLMNHIETTCQFCLAPTQKSHGTARTVTLPCSGALLYKVIKVTIGQAHHHWWKSNVCRRTTEESRKDALDICLLKPRCCVSWLELFDYCLGEVFCLMLFPNS